MRFPFLSSGTLFIGTDTPWHGLTFKPISNQNAFEFLDELVKTVEESYFPIVIKLSGPGTNILVKSPLDLPIGRSFKIVATRVQL